MHQQATDGRRRSPHIAVACLAIAAACACGDSTDTVAGPVSTIERAVIGQCRRNEAILRGTPGDCAVDLDCPCGSYCDEGVHKCAFTCMVPPANQAESCDTNSQCDDTGRCVTPGSSPAANVATLSVFPPGLVTVPAGPPQQLQARLAVHAASAVGAAAATVVRVIAKDGAQVSCDATVFTGECALSAWTFDFDGAQYNASKPVWVRTAADAPAEGGQIELRIDATKDSIARVREFLKRTIGEP